MVDTTSETKKAGDKISANAKGYSVGKGEIHLGFGI